MPYATIGESFENFFDAVDEFFSSLADIGWGSLVLALFAFTAYLSLRSRASYNVLRAAYPDKRFAWKEIWGAYFAGYGFNSVIPARGGDVVRLVLTKNAIPGATYPAVAAAFAVETVFDIVMGTLILTFAFSQGVFPKPPDFAKLNAFDLAFFAQHPQFTLFFLTFVAVAGLAAIGILSVRIRAFWARVRQGLTILFDRRRYVREVFLVQLAGWGFRFTAFWLLLEAFDVAGGGSVKNVLLVLGVQAVAAAVPFTPGGAGVQQALLVKVFGGSAAAYSVGQQIAISAWVFMIGFLSLVFIFKVRSFREVIARGDPTERRRRRRPERAAPSGLGGLLQRARPRRTTHRGRARDALGRRGARGVARAADRGGLGRAWRTRHPHGRGPAQQGRTRHRRRAAAG